MIMVLTRKDKTGFRTFTSPASSANHRSI